MHQVEHQIALSYAAQDGWIAKDIHELLCAYSLSIYCYDRMPDEARGLLRDRLRSIYSQSWLNVMLWSASYAAQPIDAFVSMERRFLAHRHANKGDSEGLIILRVDNTPLPPDLEMLLAHDIRVHGVLACERLIMGRLSDLSKRPTDHGIVCHPPNTFGIRSPDIKSCTFTIKPRFRADPLERWDSLGDVWVDFPNTEGTTYVYLIPSGLCTVHLRHSVRLRTDPRALEVKRAVTEAFAQKVGSRTLEGFWFRERKAEREIVAVYCSEYDRFLNENFDDFRRKLDRDAQQI
jgi:hypothetical protein